MVTWMNTTTRFWSTPWAIAANGTLLNDGMADLTFYNPSNSSVPFRLSREGSFGEEWGHNWDGEALAPGNTSLSFTPPSSPLANVGLLNRVLLCSIGVICEDDGVSFRARGWFRGRRRRRVPCSNRTRTTFMFEANEVLN